MEESWWSARSSTGRALSLDDAETVLLLSCTITNAASRMAIARCIPLEAEILCEKRSLPKLNVGNVSSVGAKYKGCVGGDEDKPLM